MQAEITETLRLKLYFIKMLVLFEAELDQFMRGARWSSGD